MSTTPQATLDDLGWSNIPITNVGPASPLQTSEPAKTDDDTAANERQELASVTALPAYTAEDDTVPLPRYANPTRENGTSRAQASAAPSTARPEQPPQPATVGETSPGHTLDRFSSRDEMQAEPKLPNYWGARLLSVVYWIAIVTGAGGQTFGFGAIFDIGFVGYAGAAVIATTAETVMISAGDTALKLRAQGSPARQWVPFMLIAFGAATAAAGMNVVHFAGYRVEMAVLLGGISFLGFLLHFCKGFIDSTNYRQTKREYDQRVDDLRAREEAEAEQQRQQQETQRRREAREASRQHAEDVRGSAVNAPKSATLDEIVQYALKHGLGCRNAKKAFAGYSDVPSERGIQRGLSEAKARTKAQTKAAS